LYGLVAVSSLAWAAAAQTPDAGKQPAVTDTRTFGDWGVRCFAGRLPPCEMFQASRNKAGARVMEFVIAYLPRRDSHALRLTLPLGVSFAKGVRISASGYRSQAMPYLRCDRAGCYVRGAIARGALDALGHSNPRAGLAAGSPDGRDVEMPLSLRGFIEARGAMEKLAREKSAAAPRAPR